MPDTDQTKKVVVGLLLTTLGIALGLLSFALPAGNPRAFVGAAGVGLILVAAVTLITVGNARSR